MIGVSFPRPPDVKTGGVFQVASNSAADFHFRPLTDFAARFQSGLDDEVAQPALALPETTCHFVVASGPAGGRTRTLRTCARMRAKCWIWWTSLLVAS